MGRLLRKHGIAAVPHGFRSSFWDWAAEETDHPRGVVEAALAHVMRNPAEATLTCAPTCSSAAVGSWPTGRRTLPSEAGQDVVPPTPTSPKASTICAALLAMSTGKAYPDCT